MSGTKEIRNKIKSIKSTQKITKAMEMVAASKMRRAQERMQASKPYAKKIRQVVAHLASGKTEYRHSFLQEREIKRVGLVVVTTDRGLCGGLNINLLKQTILKMRNWHKEDIEVDLCLLGSKGEAFFKRFGGNIVGKKSHIGEQPNVDDIVGVIDLMLQAYQEGRIDALYLVSNEFVNTMTQKPEFLQLLPIQVEDAPSDVKYHWDYIYEPDAKELINALLMRYVESQAYQAVVENIACEQAARMVAMKNASENASDFINQLQLAYNKARQAAITQELAEIIAGAAAV